MSKKNGTATVFQIASLIPTLKGKLIFLAIILVFGIFVVIVTLLCSIPGVTMQSGMISTEENEKYIQFAESEIERTVSTKESSLKKIKKIFTGEDIEESVADEEVIIVYSCKYGGYFDEEGIIQDRIESIVDSFFKADEDGNLVRRGFREVLAINNLTEEQMAIAVTMYENTMLNQLQEESIGYEVNTKNYGNIAYKNGETKVVYYSQRDARWANEAYGDSTIGRAGCGPTSLAIVVSSLSNKTVTPKELSDWAYKNGYKAAGGGSYWSLIPDAAKRYGLKVTGNIKKSQDVVDALADGKLVIAIMGKGHFTSSGHFIVLRGVTETGKILVADPFSDKNTKKEWGLDVILSEAKKGSGSGGPFWIISN